MRRRRKTVLIAVLLLTMGSSQAQALDYFVEGGIGRTVFQPGQDGRWVQEGLGAEWESTDMAYRAGVGIKLTPEWSLGLNYLDIGKVTVRSKYVADESYDAVLHQCIADCAHAKDLVTVDTLKGVEMIGTYTPWQGPIAPYLRGGLAIFRHGLQWETLGQQFSLAGMLASLAIGGGACYNGWACFDVTYYKGIGSTKFPVVHDALVPMLSFRYEF